MKKIISKIMLLLVLISFIGFSVLIVKTGILIANGSTNEDSFFVGMVTDGGGINDQSFQESAWKGMKNFSKNTGAKIGYVECQQSSDFGVNFDKLADAKANLIWGIGYKLADPVSLAAKINPELNYALADFSFGDDTPKNITCVTFRAEESSFLTGYIAALTTKVNQVGFIGGMRGVVIDQFEYGYKSGVAYACKQANKQVDVKVQYAETFTDAAKGKAIAIKMFDDCDIVFHAAGGAGVGIIEAAKEKGSYAIGVDMDQSFLAPNNVLTSAIKDVGKAVELISTKSLNGEDLGGKSFSLGIKEGCVGIPENNPNIDPTIQESLKKIEQKIINGEIIPAGTPAAYESYVNSLKNLKI